MTELLERAVQTLRALRPETQDALARIVLQLAGDDPTIARVNADEEASFKISFAQAERGEFATDDQIRAIWAKHGLRSCDIRFAPLRSLSKSCRTSMTVLRRAVVASRRAFRRSSTSSHPQAGQQTSARRLRRVVVHPYPCQIFYAATDDEVVIRGVRHAARRPSSMPE